MLYGPTVNGAEVGDALIDALGDVEEEVDALFDLRLAEGVALPVVELRLERDPDGATLGVVVRFDDRDVDAV